MVPVREITQAISKRAVMGTNQLDADEQSLENDRVTNKYGTDSTTAGRNDNPFDVPVGTKIRPLNEDDFKEALRKVKRTGEAARNYLKRESSSSDSVLNSRSSRSNNDIAQAMQLMQYIMAASKSDGNKIDEDEDEEDDDGSDVPSLN